MTILRVTLVALLGLLLAGAVLGFALSWWQARRIEARFPPAGAFAEVDGVRLHYFDTPARGPGADAPLGVMLLIHGASGNERDMRLPLAAPLAAAGYRVISVDRPGQGYSERGDGDVASPAVQARLIRGVVESLGVRRAVVVGHSLAGATATNLALDHPDFTAGLALLSPVTHPWPGGVAFYYKLAAAPVVGWVFTRLVATPVGLLVFDAAVRSVFAPQPAPESYAERTGAALVLRPSAFRANAQDVSALHAFVTRQAPRLAGVTAPTAIVAGDKDDIVWTDLHSRGTAAAVAGARLTVIPGMGHSPHWTHTQQALAAILDVAERARIAAR